MSDAPKKRQPLAKRLADAGFGPHSEHEEERLRKAEGAIFGVNPVEDLIDVLRRGEMPPDVQKTFADALDPSVSAVISPTLFKPTVRQRGKSAKLQKNRVEDFEKRYKAADYILQALAADPSLKQEALVAEAMQLFGLSRDTVMRGLRETRKIAAARKAYAESNKGNKKV